jgi:hypothetical protein
VAGEMFAELTSNNKSKNTITVLVRSDNGITPQAATDLSN